jgi:hypothetical protein
MEEQRFSIVGEAFSSAMQLIYQLPIGIWLAVLFSFFCIFLFIISEKSERRYEKTKRWSGQDWTVYYETKQMFEILGMVY